ncbi:prepilin peptidase [bacterium]|nr:prepilin peptidase [bacterium]
MFYFRIFFIFVFGLTIGSFLNCLIYRLHQKKSLLGRSFCPKCKHKIVWYHNIPVFSFLYLRGRCGYCGKSISWQYPIVELVTGVLFVLSFLVNFEFRISNFELVFTDFKFIIQLFRDWFIISIMIVIFIYDLKWFLILDIITLPAALFVFVLNLLLGSSWQNLVISGIIGGSFFLLQFIVSRGKWIGGGDVRLGLLMGFALGWPMVLTAIFLAYFLGSIIGIFLIVFKKKKWGSKIPLGTFLSLATVVVLFFGEKILTFYLELISF